MTLALGLSSLCTTVVRSFAQSSPLTNFRTNYLVLVTYIRLRFCKVGLARKLTVIAVVRETLVAARETLQKVIGRPFLVMVHFYFWNLLIVVSFLSIGTLSRIEDQCLSPLVQP
jgi:hypothetical protein